MLVTTLDKEKQLNCLLMQYLFISANSKAKNELQLELIMSGLLYVDLVILPNYYKKIKSKKLKPKYF